VTSEQIGVLRSMDISPDGRTLAVGGTEEKSSRDDGTIHFFDLGTGKRTHSLHGFGSAVGAVSFSPNGQRIASANWGSSITVTRLANGGQVFQTRIPRPMLFSVRYFPDGENVVCGGQQGLFGKWDAVTGKNAFLATTIGTSDVNVVDVSPDGKYFACAGQDGKIHLWEATTGTEKRSFRGHDRAVRALRFSANSEGLASAGDDLTVVIWKVR